MVCASSWHLITWRPRWALRSVVGAELSLPGFEDDPSLLTLAFSEQSALETPAGAGADGATVVSTSPLVMMVDDC